MLFKSKGKKGFSALGLLMDLQASKQSKPHSTFVNQNPPIGLCRH